MSEEQFCPNHGTELEEKKRGEVKGFLFKFMFWFRSPSKYDKYGEERTYLVCPKNDYLISS